MNKSDIPNKCLLTENTDKLAHAPLPSNDVLLSGPSFPTCVGSWLCLESCGAGLATSLPVTFSPPNLDGAPTPLQCSQPSLVPEPPGERCCEQRDA